MRSHTGWSTDEFPDADDPNDVGWLIGYWRIVPCYDAGTRRGTVDRANEDYFLESRQFAHLIKAATKREAVAKFNEYVEQKKASGKQKDIKGLTLFLSRVEVMTVISDRTGEIVQ